MPVTITTDYTAAPKVGITITTPDGSSMTAVTLYRVTGSLVEQTRVQPLTGFASRYIEDFEMAWDAPIAYRAVMTYGGGTVTQTSSTVTVTSAAAWAIHPTSPALSARIDVLDTAAAGIGTIGDSTWAATRTVHAVLDSPYPVPVRVGAGARVATATSLRVRTRTTAEAAAMRALLDNQTPILIRIPAVWGWDWEDGFYDVGDVTASRISKYAAEHGRDFALPLQRVTTPAGGQQSNWSYPQLLNDIADYPTLRARFADYPSELANTRS